MSRKISERENALKAYRHQIPEWVTLSYDAIEHIGFIGGNECGIASEGNRDVFGVKWVIAKDPTPDPSEPPVITDMSKWRDVVNFPKPKEWDWDRIKEMELANYKSDKVLVWFCEQGLFDRLTIMAGFANALCFLLTDPEECAAFFEKVADFKIELIECVAKYIKPDVFMYTDDIARKEGLFMSPDTYRQLIKPSHARIIAAIKNEGMIAEQHTCGKCDDVIPDYIEMGIESFFPAQVVNDLKGIQRKYGDRLTLVGGYDSQNAPGRIDASDEIVQAEARRIVDDYSGAGGFIAMPMIMDGTINWSIYEPSHRQKVFRDEFYRYSHIKASV